MNNICHLLGVNKLADNSYRIIWTINIRINSEASCISVTSKKFPNVYKSCPKMIPLEKLKILTPLQKLHKNAGNFGKIIDSTGFEKLPKVQLIPQSGHTAQHA